jgi:hypothetical protein
MENKTEIVSLFATGLLGFTIDYKTEKGHPAKGTVVDKYRGSTVGEYAVDYYLVVDKDGMADCIRPFQVTKVYTQPIFINSKPEPKVVSDWLDSNTPDNQDCFILEIEHGEDTYVLEIGCKAGYYYAKLNKFLDKADKRKQEENILIHADSDHPDCTISSIEVLKKQATWKALQFLKK